MTESLAQRALSGRRIERGAASRVDANAGSAAPWARANVRIWQHVMLRGMDQRYAALREYLALRKARTKGFNKRGRGGNDPS